MVYQNFPRRLQTKSLRSHQRGFCWILGILLHRPFLLWSELLMFLLLTISIILPLTFTPPKMKLSTNHEKNKTTFRHFTLGRNVPLGGKQLLWIFLHSTKQSTLRKICLPWVFQKRLIRIRLQNRMHRHLLPQRNKPWLTPTVLKMISQHQLLRSLKPKRLMRPERVMIPVLQRRLYQKLSLIWILKRGSRQLYLPHVFWVSHVPT